MKKENKQNFLSNYFFAFFVISFIFLWDLHKNFSFFFNFKNDFLNLRYLFLILLFPLPLKIYNEIKKKNYYVLINFFLIFFFIICHIFLNLFLEDKNLNLYVSGSVIFFLATYLITYFFYEKILLNLDLIIFIFFLIFFITTIFSIINFQNDAPYFCGGIGNIFGTTLGLNLDGSDKSLNEFRISFRHLLFYENSHLGMMAPAVLIYSINKIFKKKNNALMTSFIIAFFIICLIKSSTIFMVGTIISLIVLMSTNFRLLTKKTIIVYLSLIIFLSSSLIFNKECRTRFVPKYHGENILSENLTNNLEKSLKAGGSLSAGLFYRSFLITKESLIIKPFGWGLNRYSEGFDYYNKKYPPGEGSLDLFNHLNRNDGVNNFNKLLVEFGLFSLVLFVSIFKYLINRNISIDEKLFLIPLIITQMIRGAGYFNGGFILIVLIIIFSQFDKK